MRQYDDSSLRLYAYGCAILAIVSLAGLVRAYTTTGSPLLWWVLLISALAGAAHYRRKSQK